MKLPLIIGFGNPLRKDDGMGWKAAQLLEHGLPPGIADIAECHQLMPELAGDLDGVPLVLFLDASIADAPGQIRYQNVRPCPPGAWSHHLSPGQLLGMAEFLHGAAPPAFLISGGVLESDPGVQLSAMGDRCAEQMAALARSVLASWNASRPESVPQ